MVAQDLAADQPNAAVTTSAISPLRFSISNLVGPTVTG
jgi:hypothetical protein